MKLAKTNNLPLDQFINFALYDKDKGFYMKKNPFGEDGDFITAPNICLLYTSPSPRDVEESRMPSSA